MEEDRSEPIPEKDAETLEALATLAQGLGATEVRVLRPRDVPLKEALAALCLENRCEGYGRSFSCPPHVSGPAGFRALARRIPWALVIRMDVPQAVMFSDEKDEVLALVHEIVSEVERRARGMGYAEAQAFAGGSCKRIFCGEHPECRRLSGDGTCRHPRRARPSMSGFGIHVAELLRRAGCSPPAPEAPVAPDRDPMTWVAGLVLVG